MGLVSGMSYLNSVWNAEDLDMVRRDFFARDLKKEVLTVEDAYTILFLAMNTIEDEHVPVNENNEPRDLWDLMKMPQSHEKLDFAEEHLVPALLTLLRNELGEDAAKKLPPDMGTLLGVAMGCIDYGMPISTKMLSQLENFGFDLTKPIQHSSALSMSGQNMLHACVGSASEKQYSAFLLSKDVREKIRNKIKGWNENTDEIRKSVNYLLNEKNLPVRSLTLQGDTSGERFFHDAVLVLLESELVDPELLQTLLAADKPFAKKGEPPTAADSYITAKRTALLTAKALQLPDKTLRDKLRAILVDFIARNAQTLNAWPTSGVFSPLGLLNIFQTESLGSDDCITPEDRKAEIQEVLDTLQKHVPTLFAIDSKTSEHEQLKQSWFSLCAKGTADEIIQAMQTLPKEVLQARTSLFETGHLVAARKNPNYSPELCDAFARFGLSPNDRDGGGNNALLCAIENKAISDPETFAYLSARKDCDIFATDMRNTFDGAMTHIGWLSPLQKAIHLKRPETTDPKTLGVFCNGPEHIVKALSVSDGRAFLDLFESDAGRSEHAVNTICAFFEAVEPLIREGKLSLRDLPLPYGNPIEHMLATCSIVTQPGNEENQEKSAARTLSSVTVPAKIVDLVRQCGIDPCHGWQGIPEARLTAALKDSEELCAKLKEAFKHSPEKTKDLSAGLSLPEKSSLLSMARQPDISKRNIDAVIKNVVQELRKNPDLAPIKNEKEECIFSTRDVEVFKILLYNAIPSVFNDIDSQNSKNVPIYAAAKAAASIAFQCIPEQYLAELGIPNAKALTSGWKTLARQFFPEGVFLEADKEESSKDGYFIRKLHDLALKEEIRYGISAGKNLTLSDVYMKGLKPSTNNDKGYEMDEEDLLFSTFSKKQKGHPDDIHR